MVMVMTIARVSSLLLSTYILEITVSAAAKWLIQLVLLNFLCCQVRQTYPLAHDRCKVVMQDLEL